MQWLERVKPTQGCFPVYAQPRIESELLNLTGGVNAETRIMSSESQPSLARLPGANADRTYCFRSTMSMFAHVSSVIGVSPNTDHNVARQHANTRPTTYARNPIPSPSLTPSPNVPRLCHASRLTEPFWISSEYKPN
jgi:hypothetical protein